MNVSSSKSLKGSMKKVESDSSDDDGAEGEYHFSFFYFALFF
jgi:hypothetical protein